MRYLGIDFETANSSYESACAIGIAVYEEGQLLWTEHFYIKPPKEFGKFCWYNMKIHHITKRMVEKAETFDRVWEKIKGAFYGSLVICHNADFDMHVLVKLLEYYHIVVPDMDYICTVRVSQKVWPEMENHKLKTVSDCLGIPLNHHNPQSDAIAAAEIFKNSLQKMRCRDGRSLAQCVGLSIGKVRNSGIINCKNVKKCV